MRLRTGYSFKCAAGHLDEVIERIQEVFTATVAPITDRMSTFGYVNWTDKAEDAGLHPIYGVELPIAYEDGICYWTFLARDDLRPLNELVYSATTHPLSYSHANKVALSGDLIAAAGEITMLEKTHRDIPIILSPAMPRGQFAKAKADGRQFVASSDNYYTRAEDREFYRVMMGNKYSNIQTYPQHILSDDEYAEAMSWVKDSVISDAIDLRHELWSYSNAKLKQARVLSPDRPATLLEMCRSGANQIGVNLDDPIYAARLDRELKLITEKGFEDYFYIIADMVQWAKQNMIVGPGRGSSSGSLVCYLLGITAVDPIKYDLLFERFIDITRSDLPDIDLDFSDERREMVFDYAKKKYGEEHVARLGSVSMFKSRSVLNQVGVGLKIPKWTIEELSNAMILRMAGDDRATDTVEDTLANTEIGRKIARDWPEIAIASRIEGHPNNAGKHAAGLVVTQDPVAEIVAMDDRVSATFRRREDDPSPTGLRTGATMCDMRDAVKLGMLKIDVLGLTQLGIFERCMELIPQRIDMSEIPLDDQKAFDVLNDFRFSGIFQFAPQSALANMVTEFVRSGGRIDKLEDIINLTALVRPGPLNSGAAASWLRRRAGLEEVEYFHPVIKPFVEDTLGIMTFQEQVMHIAREVGDLSWDDVTTLRKGIGKSMGREYLDKFGDKWKAGAAAKGMNEKDRNKFWEDIIGFGKYAFNKAHSVSYGIISYWCMWLKAYYPLQFAAATLDSENDTDRQIAILRELEAEGVKYTPAHPKYSTDRWVVGDNELVGPIRMIIGIGEKQQQAILDARETKEPLKPSLAKKLANCRTQIDSLNPVMAAIERLWPNGLEEAGIVSEPVPIAEVQPGIRGQIVIVGVIKRAVQINENEQMRVNRRGYKFSGPVEALNLFIRDDSGDEIFCKVNRFDFSAIGTKILERCKPGSSLYALKGDIPRDFRMINIKRFVYLGEMDAKG